MVESHSDFRAPGGLARIPAGVHPHAHAPKHSAICRRSAPKISAVFPWFCDCGGFSSCAARVQFFPIREKYHLWDSFSHSENRIFLELIGEIFSQQRGSGVSKSRLFKLFRDRGYSGRSPPGHTRPHPYPGTPAATGPHGRSLTAKSRHEKRRFFAVFPGCFAVVFHTVPVDPTQAAQPDFY